MISELSSVTGDLVKTVMDVSLMRHKMIVNNIANHNTPGFVSQKLEFEAMLSAELSQSDNINNDERVLDVLNFVRPDIVNRNEDMISGNAEKALDREVAEMVENTLKYEALIRGISKLSDLTSIAITGGKR